MLAIFDRYLPEQARKDRKTMVHRAELAVESLFFRVESREIVEEETK